MPTSNKGKLNYIAVTGFILSIFSIIIWPLIPLSLIFSLVGYSNAKKCGNRGTSIASIGVAINIFLVLIAIPTLFVVLYSINTDTAYSTLEFVNLMTTIFTWVATFTFKIFSGLIGMITNGIKIFSSLLHLVF